MLDQLIRVFPGALAYILCIYIYIHICIEIQWYIYIYIWICPCSILYAKQQIQIIHFSGLAIKEWNHPPCVESPHFGLFNMVPKRQLRGRLATRSERNRPFALGFGVGKAIGCALVMLLVQEHVWGIHGIQLWPEILVLVASNGI